MRLIWSAAASGIPCDAAFATSAEKSGAARWLSPHSRKILFRAFRVFRGENF
jgi:hypothetical protein